MADFLNTQFDTKKQKVGFINHFLVIFEGKQALFNSYFNSTEHRWEFVKGMKQHAVFLQHLNQEGTDDLYELVTEKLGVDLDPAYKKKIVTRKEMKTGNTKRDCKHSTNNTRD